MDNLDRLVSPFARREPAQVRDPLFGDDHVDVVFRVIDMEDYREDSSPPLVVNPIAMIVRRL